MSRRIKILCSARRLRRDLLLLLVIASSPAFAQSSASLRACNQNARSQAELNACANEEATRAERDLHRVYTRLLAQASSQPEAVEKIKAAEKAWLSYRDAYLEAMYPAADKQAEYGTIYPMEANLLRAKLARQHIFDLKEMLRHDDGSK